MSGDPAEPQPASSRTATAIVDTALRMSPAPIGPQLPSLHSGSFLAAGSPFPERADRLIRSCWLSPLYDQGVEPAFPTADVPTPPREQGDDSPAGATEDQRSQGA